MKQYIIRRARWGFSTNAAASPSEAAVLLASVHDVRARVSAASCACRAHRGRTAPAAACTPRITTLCHARLSRPPPQQAQKELDVVRRQSVIAGMYKTDRSIMETGAAEALRR